MTDWLVRARDGGCETEERSTRRRDRAAGESELR